MVSVMLSSVPIRSQVFTCAALDAASTVPSREMVGKKKASVRPVPAVIRNSRRPRAGGVDWSCLVDLGALADMWSILLSPRGLGSRL